jgi:hypothetical protein
MVGIVVWLEGFKGTNHPSLEASYGMAWGLKGVFICHPEPKRDLAA